VLGIPDAEHAEDAPRAMNLVVVPVACPTPNAAAAGAILSGVMNIRLAPGSTARAVYAQPAIDEHYFCSFEMNPDYRERFEQGGLRVAGLGPGGEVRIVELPSHPFFVATLFQPQRSSRVGAPNPLVSAFVRAASSFAETRRKQR